MFVQVPAHCNPLSFGYKEPLHQHIQSEGKQQSPIFGIKIYGNQKVKQSFNLTITFGFMGK